MSSSRTQLELTSSGLPLDHTQSATRTTDKGGDGGVARRIDCGSPPSANLLQKAPTDTLNLKQRSGAAQDENVKPRRRRSLVDDDDDEIVDYFHKTSYDNNNSETLAAPTTTSTSPFWPVSVSTIPSLPSLNYPLEKTSVYIPSQQILSPSIISQRIVSILQQRSISATYDTSNAKVDCITKTNVEFRIRLYLFDNNNKGQTITGDNNNNNQNGIIVEIQRRNGFSISYMKDVRAILDAVGGEKKIVRGKEEDIDEGENVNVLRRYWETIEEGGDSCDMSSSSEEENMVRGCTSLRIISNLLCPQEDQVAVPVENQDLALDSLASLTSLEHMGSKVAIKVSNEILTSETCADLRHVVFSNVGRPTRQDPQDCTVRSSTLQSLKVLANVSSNSSKLGKLLSQNEDEILSKLIDNIENAKVNPQVADLSCIILKNIEGTAASSLPPQYKERLSKALMVAGRYGATCYADLELHAQECMDHQQ